jgi:hypothetical protein
MSNEAASREELAVWTNAVLDENVIDYVASDKIFEEATKDGETYTLLADSFGDSVKIEGALVTDVNLSDGDVKLTVYGDLGDNDEVDLISTSEFLDDVDSTITATPILAKVKDGKLLYLVLEDADILGSDE